MTCSENSFELTKQNLEDLRRERKLTFKQLSKELASQGLNITDTNLRNYEQNDKNSDLYDRTKGMAIEKLLAFANFYDVSADFLLGRTKVRKFDPELQAQAACEYTGLEEQAIDKIKALDSSSKQNRDKALFFVLHSIELLNEFFEINFINEVMEAFLRFLNDVEKHNHIEIFVNDSTKEREIEKEIWWLHKQIDMATDAAIKILMSKFIPSKGQGD